MPASGVVRVLLTVREQLELRVLGPTEIPQAARGQRTSRSGQPLADTTPGPAAAACNQSASGDQTEQHLRRAEVKERCHVQVTK